MARDVLETTCGQVGIAPDTEVGAVDVRVPVGDQVPQPLGREDPGRELLQDRAAPCRAAARRRTGRAATGCSASPPEPPNRRRCRRSTPSRPPSPRPTQSAAAAAPRPRGQHPPARRRPHDLDTRPFAGDPVRCRSVLPSTTTMIRIRGGSASADRRAAGRGVQTGQAPRQSHLLVAGGHHDADRRDVDDRNVAIETVTAAIPLVAPPTSAGGRTRTSRRKSSSTCSTSTTRPDSARNCRWTSSPVIG